MQNVNVNVQQLNVIKAQCYAMQAHCTKMLNNTALAEQAAQYLQELAALQTLLSVNTATAAQISVIADLTENAGDESSLANDFFAIYNAL